MEVKITTCPVCGNRYFQEDYPECPICAGSIKRQGETEAMPDRNYTMNGTATMPLHTPETERRATAETEADFGKTLPPDYIPPQPENWQTASGNMGMTQPPYSIQKKTTPPHDPVTPDTTTPVDFIPGHETPAAYIVGWLVALNGKKEGEDYRIRGFNTTIGRGQGNTIVLAEDSTISRDVNCAIRYYSETKEYYIVLGQNPKNAVYINGKSLIDQAQLHAYDVIKIGRTELLFVPLCGREFSWNGEER